MAIDPRRRVAVVTLTLCALAAVGIYVARSPFRNAAKIQRGDSASDVHKLLGEPEAVFKTTEELRSSYLRPMSYVFTDKSGRSGISVDELPSVVSHAEWFGYASAGHLVYYDDNGVTDVFWGGT
jgi:hypothetical protein